MLIQAGNHAKDPGGNQNCSLLQGNTCRTKAKLYPHEEMRRQQSTQAFSKSNLYRMLSLHVNA